MRALKGRYLEMIGVGRESRMLQVAGYGIFFFEIDLSKEGTETVCLCIGKGEAYEL